MRVIGFEINESNNTFGVRIVCKGGAEEANALCKKMMDMDALNAFVHGKAITVAPPAPVAPAAPRAAPPAVTPPAAPAPAPAAPPKAPKPAPVADPDADEEGDVTSAGDLPAEVKAMTKLRPLVEWLFNTLKLAGYTEMGEWAVKHKASVAVLARQPDDEAIRTKIENSAKLVGIEA